LFDAHPEIRCIAFNGGTAEREYRRRVVPALAPSHRCIQQVRLPSTSPAHAALSVDAKRAAWQVLLEHTAGT